MQARQTADRRERPDRIERTVPGARAGEVGQWPWCKLQPFLQAACESIEGRRLDIATKLRPIGLHEPVGVALIPAKAATDEQALRTHGYVLAGHHIARQSSDVAAVA